MAKTSVKVSLGVSLAIATLATGCQDSTGPGGKGQLSDVKSVQVIDTAGSIFRSINVQLAKQSRVEVFYKAADGGEVLRVRADSASLSHSILLPRLFASRTYQFAVRTYADSLKSDSIFRGTFTTGALPAELQGFNYTMEGDPTFPIIMAPFRTTPGGFAGQVAFDTRGRGIVWFMRSAGGTLVAAPIPQSNDMLFIEGGFPGDQSRNGLVRAGPNANVVAFLERGSGEFGQIHHDMVAVDKDRVLFLAFETRTIRDTAVTGESIWEWNTKTNAVARKWSSFEALNWDVDRVPGTQPSAWLHANSIMIGNHGNIIVSFRTQSQVISIAPDFKSIEWKLGGASPTVKVAPGDATKGQHSASQLANGNVLVFDNQGGGPNDDHSRVTEFQIANDSARVAWQYDPQPSILAQLRGGTYRLASGNTLAIFTSLPFEAHEVATDKTLRWRMTGDFTFFNMFRAAPWYSIGGEEVVPAMP